MAQYIRIQKYPVIATPYFGDLTPLSANYSLISQEGNFFIGQRGESTSSNLLFSYLNTYQNPRNVYIGAAKNETQFTNLAIDFKVTDPPIEAGDVAPVMPGKSFHLHRKYNSSTFYWELYLTVCTYVPATNTFSILSGPTLITGIDDPNSSSEHFVSQISATRVLIVHANSNQYMMTDTSGNIIVSWTACPVTVGKLCRLGTSGALMATPTDIAPATLQMCIVTTNGSTVTFSSPVTYSGFLGKVVSMDTASSGSPYRVIVSSYESEVVLVDAAPPSSISIGSVYTVPPIDAVPIPHVIYATAIDSTRYIVTGRYNSPRYYPYARMLNGNGTTIIAAGNWTTSLASYLYNINSGTFAVSNGPVVYCSGNTAVTVCRGYINSGLYVIYFLPLTFGP